MQHEADVYYYFHLDVVVCVYGIFLHECRFNWRRKPQDYFEFRKILLLIFCE
jgi:hypothetical protein